MITIILFTHVVYAKYVTIEKINSIFKIATPIFIVEGKEKLQINELNNIGFYEFSVKNFKENEISETGFLYSIEIISKLENILEFELYSEDSIIELNNLKTEKILISGNKKIEQNYKLKIKYNNLYENINEDIWDEVQIKIHSEQEKI